MMSKEKHAYNEGVATILTCLVVVAIGVAGIIITGWLFENVLCSILWDCVDFWYILPGDGIMRVVGNLLFAVIQLICMWCGEFEAVYDRFVKLFDRVDEKEAVRWLY